MIKKYIFLLLAACLFSFYASAQSDKEKAGQLHEQAIALMDDKGDFEGAIKLLEEASKLEPKNPDHKYEIAYAQYELKNYDQAKDILIEILKDKGATFRYYQLLGNVYDIQGEPEKALGVYRAGLKKWPEDGHLYNEMAIVEMGRKDYNTAMGYWEKGIEIDPSFSSNYYWASKVFCQTDNRLWGLIYGEIFLNLERNSKRTVEISALLYKTYLKCISIGDSTVRVSFVKDNVMYFDPKKKMKLPFSAFYETTMSITTVKYVINKQKTLGLNDLSDIRAAFITSWYEKSLAKEYPNILFDWQKKLQDNNYLESYNHWIMKGNEDEFDAWIKDHKDNFDEFAKWFKDNPIPIDKKHHFYRAQYN